MCHDLIYFVLTSHDTHDSFTALPLELIIPTRQTSNELKLDLTIVCVSKQLDQIFFFSGIANRDDFIVRYH